VTDSASDKHNVDTTKSVIDASVTSLPVYTAADVIERTC